MTAQEYVTALSFFAFVMLMTGGIGVAVFWRPKKKSVKTVEVSAKDPVVLSGTAPLSGTKAA